MALSVMALVTQTIPGDMAGRVPDMADLVARACDVHSVAAVCKNSYAR